MEAVGASGFVQILNALALSSLLLILASGLALIFGLRDILNFAHGAIYMVGAYLSLMISKGASFWVALIAVPIIVAAFGIVFEFALLRPLARRSQIDVALVTFGLAMIINQGVIAFFGSIPYAVATPPFFSGSTIVFGLPYPTYRLFVILVGFASCLALEWWLAYTRSGMYVRAVSHNAVVAKMMGVDTDRLSLFVVCLSFAFASLAGVVAGPYLSLDPQMGSTILISCLIVVVIGGLGSIGGAIVASVLYGFIQVIGVVYFPKIASLVPYFLLFLVLIWRPQGFGWRARTGQR